MMNTLPRWVLPVALVTIIAIATALLNFQVKVSAAPSTPGTSLVPTTLSGGSVPSLLSALEAGESFISDGVSWFMATTTESNATAAGTISGPVYEVKAGIDYAYTQQSFTATSAVPMFIQNPYGTATTSVDSIVCNITANGLGAIAFDLSTSSSAYGSSTPAFVSSHTVAATGQDTTSWTPMLYASSTLSKPTTLFTADNAKDGKSPFFLQGTDALTLRIATTTPAGTFATYLSGTCAAQFRKS